MELTSPQGQLVALSAGLLLWKVERRRKCIGGLFYPEALQDRAEMEAQVGHESLALEEFI